MAATSWSVSCHRPLQMVHCRLSHVPQRKQNHRRLCMAMSHQTWNKYSSTVFSASPTCISQISCTLWLHMQTVNRCGNVQSASVGYGSCRDLFREYCVGNIREKSLQGEVEVDESLVAKQNTTTEISEEWKYGLLVWWTGVQIGWNCFLWSSRHWHPTVTDRITCRKRKYSNNRWLGGIQRPSCSWVYSLCNRAQEGIQLAVLRQECRWTENNSHEWNRRGVQHAKDYF